MWNENNILDNDMSSKFEGKMFCNFGGGGSSSASSDTGGYDVFGTGAVGDTTNFSSGGGSYSDDSPSYSGGGYVDTSSLAGLLEASAGTTPAAQSAAQQIQEALNAPSYMDMQSAPPMMQDPYEMENLAAQQRLSELANRMTNVNFRSVTDPISSLNQLAMRAGQAPMPSGQGILGKLQMPSFLGAGASALGQWATGSMYEDIQKGYIPQYDAAGQIVATINPVTGQLGRGSVESRIDYNNPDTIAERQGLEKVGVSILDDFGMGRTSTDETPEVPEYLLRGQGGGVAEPVTQDISMIPTGQIAAGGTPMYRQTMLDVAPTQYGGLLAGTTPSDFDVANRAFRMTGATYPEYFQDPYNLTGYSILT
jgi:hypothetical protein